MKCFLKNSIAKNEEKKNENHQIPNIKANHDHT